MHKSYDIIIDGYNRHYTISWERARIECYGEVPAHWEISSSCASDCQRYDETYDTFEAAEERLLEDMMSRQKEVIEESEKMNRCAQNRLDVLASKGIDAQNRLDILASKGIDAFLCKR